VPQTEAPLLVPKRVAGMVLGYAVNRVGTKMSPPPPTIESTNPATPAAIVMKIKLKISKAGDDKVK